MLVCLFKAMLCWLMSNFLPMPIEFRMLPWTRFHNLLLLKVHFERLLMISGKWYFSATAQSLWCLQCLINPRYVNTIDIFLIHGSFIFFHWFFMISQPLNFYLLFCIKSCSESASVGMVHIFKWHVCLMTEYLNTYCHTDEDF